MSNEYENYLSSLTIQGGAQGLSAFDILVKYSEDQARDNNGEFASGTSSGGDSQSHSSDRWSAMEYHSHMTTQHGISSLKAGSAEERQALKAAAAAHIDAHTAARENGVDSAEYKAAAQKADAADNAISRK